jgi:hypothetical protein
MVIYLEGFTTRTPFLAGFRMADNSASDTGSLPERFSAIEFSQRQSTAM